MLTERNAPRCGLFLAVTLTLVLAACGGRDAPRAAEPAAALFPGETTELRALIDYHADLNGVPRSLVHRVVQRESNYRPEARNGPYYGLMQILPETARTMGFRGAPEALLDPDTNLRYGVRYLRGAWLVADGDAEAAVMWYARGYYFEARDRCMLVETGLLDREIRRDC